MWALPACGVAMSVYNAHSTQGVGVGMFAKLEIRLQLVCEIGSWKNIEAFTRRYSRLFAADKVGGHLGQCWNTSLVWGCGGSESSMTPPSDHARGTSEDEQSEQEHKGPYAPHLEPALPQEEAKVMQVKVQVLEGC